MRTDEATGWIWTADVDQHSTGEVKLAWIYKDELVTKKLKMGDVVHIDAGSTFYMVNSGKGQRLHVICSIDASDGLGFGPPYQVRCSAFYILLSGTYTKIHISAFPAAASFNEMQAFYLGGVGRPTSVLAGFESKTLAVAFNVSSY